MSTVNFVTQLIAFVVCGSTFLFFLGVAIADREPVLGLLAISGIALILSGMASE